MEDLFSEKIKKIAESLLESMGFAGTVEVVKNNPAERAGGEEGGEADLICNININTDNDSSILIGQYGANLQSLQHIIRLLVRKQTQEKINFIVDVNSYRQQKTQAIIEQAHLAAKQAIDEKRAVVLRPMSAYERRLVHLELSKNNQVATESVGEGDERKVIVKPAGTFI